MYTDNRDAYRQAFFIAWDKYKKQQMLNPVEAQLVEIMLVHPEYHPLLENPKQFEKQEFSLEENPFFHMSLHVAIREQVRTDRPAGVAAIYQTLSTKFQDPHEAEHAMLTCLAQILWQAQQSGSMESEAAYLENLKKLSSNK